MRIANRVDVGNVGFRFFAEPSMYKPKETSKRGEIRGFSKSSVRRLRDLLVFGELTTTERARYGYTFTVPWSDLDDVYRDYKASFNRFGVSFSRALPNSCIVFRHELQKRKAPHWHGVLYLSVYDDFDDGLLASLWRRAIRPVKRGGSVSSFLRYGVKGVSLDDGFAAFRYLCDHESKSKQDQLGYVGKQWGVLNRRKLVTASESFSFDSRRDLIDFYRLCRRYGRFTVFARERRKRGKDGLCNGPRLPLDCPFGSKKCRSRKQVAAVFAPPGLLERFLDCRRHCL